MRCSGPLGYPNVDCPILVSSLVCRCEEMSKSVGRAVGSWTQENGNDSLSNYSSRFATRTASTQKIE